MEDETSEIVSVRRQCFNCGNMFDQKLNMSLPKNALIPIRRDANGVPRPIRLGSSGLKPPSHFNFYSSSDAMPHKRRRSEKQRAKRKEFYKKKKLERKRKAEALKVSKVENEEEEMRDEVTKLEDEILKMCIKE
jgi:hypothetical protein